MTEEVIREFVDSTIVSRGHISIVGDTGIVWINRFILDTETEEKEFQCAQREVVMDGETFMGLPVKKIDSDWILRDAEILDHTPIDHDEFMQMGVDRGWWESFNDHGPIPFPIVFVMETREIRKNFNGLWKTIETLEERETLMAHVLGKAGIFESVGEAKKNGWKKPIQPGTFKFKKKGITLEILED